MTVIKCISNFSTVLDALGKPGSGIFEGNYLWLGSFSECAKMEKFKYCLAGFELKVHSIWKDADVSMTTLILLT